MQSCKISEQCWLGGLHFWHVHNSPAFSRTAHFQVYLIHSWAFRNFLFWIKVMKQGGWTLEGILIEMPRQAWTLLDLQFLFQYKPIATQPAPVGCFASVTPRTSLQWGIIIFSIQQLHPCSSSSNCPHAAILIPHYTGTQIACFDFQVNPFGKPYPHDPGCWFKQEYLQVRKIRSWGRAKKNAVL